MPLMCNYIQDSRHVLWRRNDEEVWALTDSNPRTWDVRVNGMVGDFGLGSVMYMPTALSHFTHITT